MKPVTPGLAKEKLETGTKETANDTIMLDIQTQAQQWQEGRSNLASRMEDSSTDSEAEEALDNDGTEPATSIFDQLEPGAGEAESTFAIMGADDVALDMDTEVGYISEDESKRG